MIVLVRHGETDANRAGLLLGQADPPLNALGRQQAVAVADALRREPIDVIHTSPLLRARETAAEISEATGAPLEVDERLIELDYGEWDLRPLAELPRDVAATWRADPTFAPPGGESLVDLRARVGPCAAALLDHAGGGATVAVSHVSPIKAIVLWALDLDDRYAWRLRLDVASMSRLAPGPAGPTLVGFNDTGHLR